MQLQAASPFFPGAPAWRRPQPGAGPVEEAEARESVELSASPAAPSREVLQATGRRGATEAAAPLLGLFARAAGGNCPYLQATPRVGAVEFAGTVLGNLGNPHQVLEKLHQRHGERFQVGLPGRAPLLFDSRPEVVHQALTGTRGKNGRGVWEKSPELAHGFSHLFGTQNVFSGTGAAWRESREILEPSFRGDVIHRQETVDHVAAVFDRHLADVPEGELDLRGLTQRAALDSAFQVMFGARLNRQELDETLDAFGKVRRTLAAETLNPTGLSLAQMGARGLRGAHETLIGLADRLIAERRASGQARGDALGALLASPLSPERVRQEVLTLMLSGHETTASLLSWALLELAHDPAEQERLASELAPLQGAVPRQGAMHEQTDGVREHLMKTMRQRSPAYLLARVAQEDTRVGDTPVPAGTTLVMSPLLAHRHPSNGPSAKMFGFGGGTRLCLGQNLARLEGTVFLTRFLQRFALEPVSGLEAASDVSHHPREARVRVRLRPDVQRAG